MINLRCLSATLIALATNNKKHQRGNCKCVYDKKGQYKLCEKVMLTMVA